MVLSLLGDPFRCNNRASPTRVIYLWQILQNRLPTKDRLAKWGLQCDPSCVLCQHGDENRDHLFSACSYIQDIYLHIKVYVPDFCWPASFRNVVQIMSRMSKRKKSKSSLFPMIWGEVLYQTWLQTNARALVIKAFQLNLSPIVFCSWLLLD